MTVGFLYITKLFTKYYFIPIALTFSQSEESKV
jgi:hypothetical protein